MQKYVHKVLVNLPRMASVVRWTDSPDMAIAVDWDVKNQTKQINKYALSPDDLVLQLVLQ